MATRFNHWHHFSGRVQPHLLLGQVLHQQAAQLLGVEVLEAFQQAGGWCCHVFKIDSCKRKLQLAWRPKRLVFSKLVRQP